MKNYLLNLGGAAVDIFVPIIVFVVCAAIFIKYVLPLICWAAAGCEL